MGIVPQVFVGKAAVFIAEEGHPRIIAEGHRLGVTPEEQLHQHRLNDGTVAEHRYRLVRVFFGNLFQSFQEAAGASLKGLSPRHPPMNRVPAELFHCLPVVVVQVSIGQILPDTHTPLTEPGIPVQGQIPGHIDTLGGLAGAHQVAGIYRIHRNMGKPLPKVFHLLQASGGQLSVELAMEPAEYIALRLCMAYDIDFCHSMVTLPVKFRWILSTASAACSA